MSISIESGLGISKTYGLSVPENYTPLLERRERVNGWWGTGEGYKPTHQVRISSSEPKVPAYVPVLERAGAGSLKF